MKNQKKGEKMMKSLKKFLMIGLSLSLLVSSFVGCASKKDEANNTSTTTGSASTTEVTAATTEASKKYTITYAKIVSASPDKDSEVLKYWNDKYNVDLQIIEIDRNKYNELLNLKISAGEIPDTFMLDGNLSQYKKFKEQGILAELTEDLVEKNSPDLFKVVQPHWNNLKLDGKVYSLTGVKVSNRYPLVAIWRDDWLKNVGITKIPETLEEAEKALYAFTKNDPDKNGKNDTYGLGKSGMDAIFGAYGGIPWGPWPQYWLWLDQGGKLVNTTAMPEMKEALKVLSKWYKDGVLDPEYVLGENKGGYWALSHDFIKGKIGYTGLGHYYHWAPPQSKMDKGGQDYQEFKATNPNGTYVTGTPVIGPTGKSGTWKYPEGVGAAAMQAFSSKADKGKLERMLQVMNGSISNLDDGLKAIYGIKGKTWDYDEDKNVVAIGDNSKPEVIQKVAMSLGIIVNPEFEKKNTPNLYAYADKNFSYKGYENKLLAGLPSESKYRPDLEKLRDQYYTEIITGKKPVDAFDEFIVKWKAQGGDQLEKEANEWYATVK